MENIEKAKKLIEKAFKNNILILANIAPRCVQLGISNQDVETALQELEQEKVIRIEKIRPLFWQWRIIKQQNQYIINITPTSGKQAALYLIGLLLQKLRNKAQGRKYYFPPRTNNTAHL